MPTKKVKTVSKKSTSIFYRISLSEKESSSFYPEYAILSKTVESVNNFNTLYKAGKVNVKGAIARGPSTHDQQDLYRAMLVFACAGLDMFVKQLIKNKLPQLLTIDENAKNQFKEYVKRGLRKDDKVILNTIALALIDNKPRDIFLSEYVESMTEDSLQSANELIKVSRASGLDYKKIFSSPRINSLNNAFEARNQIIHEMDINIQDGEPRSTGYRTRRQRIAKNMETHTKTILKLAEELFVAYKDKFDKFQIGIEKKQDKVS